jgi:hypothetical protein
MAILLPAVFQSRLPINIYVRKRIDKRRLGRRFSMAEKIVKANGIDICTEVFGDPNDLPILLVMGAGGSMLHWGK